ncbi:MAG TPA: glycosyltransferase [Gammaproteobacteria bacterium]|nr:glycosyltransferase [Gammaproteobacteria bacterium]
MATTLLSINNYYYPRGGAEVVFFRHNGMLHDAGWDVVPFAMNHRMNIGGERSEFVSEIEYGRESDGLATRLRKGLKAVYSFEARSKLARLIDRSGPDLCHAHNVYHHLSPSILGLVRARGIPLVMTLHDLKIACPAYSMLTHDGICERCKDGRLYQVVTNRCMKGSLALSALVMLESYLHLALGSYLRNVDRFLVPSRFYLHKLVEWGFPAERFEYVPNFVATESFEACYSPGDRFVYFGRLSPEKGVATLIRAADEAGVGVDVIGTGPAESELRALAVNRDVRFLGYLTGTKLNAAVSAARAVVVPSEWYENAPLAVLEGAALGKPLIVARIGGLPELVVEGESGWSFESRSVGGLAAILRRVAQLPDADVAATGMAARRRIEDEFSPQRYLERIRGVYGRLGVAWP